MSDSNAGQRKMIRRTRATVHGYHGANPWRSRLREMGVAGGRIRGAKKLARAIKKRMKTRESRAMQEGEL